MKNLGKIILTIVVIFILAIGIAILYHSKEVNTTQNENAAKAMENDKSKIASYETENEKISLEIPENWNYEIIDKEDESHYYSIKLYPNEEEKNKCAVVYSEKQRLGVCGTGLTTKEIETNHQNKASVGYFDNHTAWDYIAYQIEGVNLVAYNEKLEEKEAIEALEILKTLQFEKKIETANSTFEMTIKEGTLTTTSATVIIKNKNKDSFGTDEWFQIQKKENGEWKELPILSLVSWIDIAYISNEDGVMELKQQWKDLYGELQPGEYRIAKQISTKQYVYAEFIIK